MPYRKLIIFFKRSADFGIVNIFMMGYSVLFFLIVLPALTLGYVLGQYHYILIDGARFGPLMTDCDRLLRMQICAQNKKNKKIRYVGLVDCFVNNDLRILLERHMSFIVSPLLRRVIIQVVAKFSFIKKIPFIISRDISNNAYVFSKCPTPEKFSEEDEEKGQNALLEMGIGPDDWFICFHARTSTYLDSLNVKRDWSYHDYRDSSIKNFYKMVDKVVEQGGVAIRMGAIGEEPLEMPSSPKIIDYANEYKTDFLDLYLSAKCKFFIAGGGSGLGSASMFFDVPVAWSNLIPVPFLPWQRNNLFIPKLLWCQTKERLLTFDEMQEAGVFQLGSGADVSDHYKSRGLELVQNDEDDILDLYLEMLDRLNDVEQDQEEMKLQNKFRERYFNHEPDFEWGGDIGGRFLKKHFFLFD
ncbi:MAG: TIGR04372 family glycosyltransferase [Mariprofundaceae bacterium]|nr:TIGR04372 family glycosyltransferase [Mariprofundaceae bacterium]